MKKLLLVAVVSLCALVSANAQINQGAVLVGGSSNLGFTNVSPDVGDSYSKFQLQGKVGYFFIDNLTGGVKLDYQKVDEASSLGLGIFGRYYLNNVIILGATLGTSKRDSGVADASSTWLGLEGGYAAFITDAIAIEPTLNIDIFSGDFDETNFGLNVGISLYLGRD
jgi:hypothetical protein